ncbi:MAG: AI-2E family transporter [Acidimicrobiia bacterium]|nr:AI-2E family transporter [Actinomycetota bacterium]MBL6924392.1 AI-2E family transporter [Acidimicrobiia bacterium]MBL6926161.1 AI-2E family transporter [Acidimicrobiia bacterium]
MFFSVPSAPPAWLNRALVALLGGVIAFWYLRGILASLRSLFLILLVALFLSFALEPAVNRLERMGMRRGIGTALIFLLGIGALGGFGTLVGTMLAEQVTAFSENVPSYLRDIDVFLEDTFGIAGATTDLRADYDEGMARRLGAVANDLARFGTTIVNVLFQLFTVGLFAFYMLAEGPKFRRTVCSLLPAQKQRSVLRVWDLAIAKTGGYILSRTILALASMAVHWVAFELIGLPSPLALALWVGVMSQFVPVVGTYIAGSIPIVIGLLEEPVHGFWALVVIAVYQQVENYLFAPRITAQTMQLHAAVAFGSVIAGAAVLGVIGALLALPAAATVQAVLSSTARRHEVAEELLAESRQRRGRQEPPSQRPQTKDRTTSDPES